VNGRDALKTHFFLISLFFFIFGKYFGIGGQIFYFDTFYDVYSSIKSAIALWKALDKKYRVEDVGVKNISDFKMTNSTAILNQIQEF
jgi:hypothetical protein